MRLLRLLGIKEKPMQLPEVQAKAAELVARIDADLAQLKADEKSRAEAAAKAIREHEPIAAELALAFPDRTWTAHEWGIRSDDAPSVEASRPIIGLGMSVRRAPEWHWQARSGCFSDRGQTAVIAVRDVLRSVAENKTAALTDANLASFRDAWPSWEFTRKSGKRYSGRPIGDDNAFHGGYIELADGRWKAFHPWPTESIGSGDSPFEAMRVVVEKERA